jgi:hypothetical protein
LDLTPPPTTFGIAIANNLWCSPKATTFGIAFGEHQSSPPPLVFAEGDGEHHLSPSANNRVPAASLPLFEVDRWLVVGDEHDQALRALLLLFILL